MTPRTVIFLAEFDTFGMIKWSAVVLAAIIVLLLVIKAMRKWMNADDVPQGAGFTLSDLRRYHKEGKMTDDEYEKAKAILIGSVKARTDKPAEGPRTGGGGLDAGPPGA